MPLSKLSVAINGLPHSVKTVIEQDWSPGPLKNEREYRDSLTRVLRESAQGAYIEVEYRHGGTTTDIYLKWPGLLASGELFIELKYNLRQKTEYDRLVGQIEQLNPKKNCIVLVLCGPRTNESLIARLRERYRDLLTPAIPLDGQMVLVEKK